MVDLKRALLQLAVNGERASIMHRIFVPQQRKSQSFPSPTPFPPLPAALESSPVSTYDGKIVHFHYVGRLNDEADLEFVRGKIVSTSSTRSKAACARDSRCCAATTPEELKFFHAHCLESGPTRPVLIHIAKRYVCALAARTPAGDGPTPVAFITGGFDNSASPFYDEAAFAAAENNGGVTTEIYGKKYERDNLRLSACAKELIARPSVRLWMTSQDRNDVESIEFPGREKLVFLPIGIGYRDPSSNLPEADILAAMRASLEVLVGGDDGRLIDGRVLHRSSGDGKNLAESGGGSLVGGADGSSSHLRFSNGNNGSGRGLSDGSSGVGGGGDGNGEIVMIPPGSGVMELLFMSFSVHHEEWSHRNRTVETLERTFAPGLHHQKLDSGQTLRRTLDSVFAVSPRGTGSDCWRHYESAAYGSLVLADDHFTLSSSAGAGFGGGGVLAGLPIVFVRDWRNITCGALRAAILDARRRAAAGGYEMERLTLRYWIDFVWRAVDEAWRESDSGG
ncbi:unnamed protein product [Phaeothamnion confervicola]